MSASFQIYIEWENYKYIGMYKIKSEEYMLKSFTTSVGMAT